MFHLMTTAPHFTSSQVPLAARVLSHLPGPRTVSPATYCMLGNRPLKDNEFWSKVPLYISGSRVQGSGFGVQVTGFGVQRDGLRVLV